jgi:hypothetical protein
VIGARLTTPSSKGHAFAFGADPNILRVVPNEGAASGSHSETAGLRLSPDAYRKKCPLRKKRALKERAKRTSALAVKRRLRTWRWIRGQPPTWPT